MIHRVVFFFVTLDTQAGPANPEWVPAAARTKPILAEGLLVADADVDILFGIHAIPAGNSRMMELANIRVCSHSW